VEAAKGEKSGVSWIAVRYFIPLHIYKQLLGFVK